MWPNWQLDDGHITRNAVVLQILKILQILRNIRTISHFITNIITKCGPAGNLMMVICHKKCCGVTNVHSRDEK